MKKLREELIEAIPILATTTSMRVNDCISEALNILKTEKDKINMTTLEKMFKKWRSDYKLEIKEDEKQCERCKKIKLKVEFAVNKKKADGRQPICKQCKKDIKHMQFLETDKTCHVCKKTLPRTNKYFYNNKSSPDGLQGACIECIKEGGSSRIGREYVAAPSPKPSLNRNMINRYHFKEGTSYKVIIPIKRKNAVEFEGILIYQTDRYIVLRHKKHGYSQSFLKVDFLTGERELREVI